MRNVRVIGVCGYGSFPPQVAFERTGGDARVATRAVTHISPRSVNGLAWIPLR